MKLSIHETHKDQTPEELRIAKREMEKDCVDCPENVEPILAKQAHFATRREINVKESGYNNKDLMKHK